MSTSKSRFVVAKLDAGMAILLTPDHHLIEFPSLLLPSGVSAGSIIDLSVAQNTKKEKEEHDNFIALQNEIQNLFAVHPPATPELHVRNTTQTSVVLEWNLLDLATAEMKSLSLYKNGAKLGKIPNATTTTTKLSGLALDTEYTFQLILRTTAGTYKSNELKVKTHKMTNLTGLNVCLSNVKAEESESVKAILARIGAKPPHERVRIDTTHFVTNRGVGDEFKKAQSLNIPVVVPEFVEACEAEGRLMRVGSYYLDSDPTLRTRRTNPVPQPIPDRNAQEATTQSQKEGQAQNTDAVPKAAAGDTSLAPEQPASSSGSVMEGSSSKGKEVDHGDAAPTVVSQVANVVVASAKQVQAVASEGVAKATEAITSSLGDSTQHDTQGELVSPAEAAPAKDVSTKEEVEPHQAAVKSVIDLPAQIDTSSDNQESSFPPSMGRANTEEMEDVAL